MDIQSDAGHERKCASCYWFIPIFGGVRRCCCGASSLCGNDEPEQSCDHWSLERPSSRKKATELGNIGEIKNGEGSAPAENDIDSK